MTQVINALVEALSSIQKKSGGWAIIAILLAGWMLYSAWKENEDRKILEVRLQRIIDSLQNELITAKIQAAQYKQNSSINNKEL
jgi:hypothetical protein